jgi:anti-sigma28 factor (negative regulator of flagellin synthesis)
MEIGGAKGLTAIEKKFQPAAYITGKDRQANANVSEHDKVELSNHGRNISLLNDLINSVPDIRESRVEEVLSLMKSNTYNVNTEQVAEKIIKGDFLDEII